jgi:hypothetical protein
MTSPGRASVARDAFPYPAQAIGTKTGALYHSAPRGVILHAAFFTSRERMR